MEEFICITILSQVEEEEASFKARLSQFWTQMLRSRKEDFEKVFAESTEFEEDEGALARQYLVEEEVVDILEQELKNAGLDYEPIDREERFSRYEAAPPEWMQIEH